MTRPRHTRPVPFWPLALAFAASLFLTRTEAQLILLALIIAALLYAAARLLPEAATDTAPNPATRLGLSLPGGMGTALAVLTLLALFASVPFSTLPSTSLCFAWILGLFPLGYLLGLAALARGARWQRLELAAGALITFVAVWGVIEWLRFGDRSNGPFLDYNAFGALFYLAVPPAFLALAQARSLRVRAALVGFLALCLWALFATLSRGATGILLLLLAPLILGLRRAGVPWRAPAAMLLVLVGLAYGTVRYAPAHPVTREVVNLSADQSTQDRLAMWRATLDIWRERPLLGMGLGSYKLHYLHYRSPEEHTSTGDLAHNDYLQTLAEGGPLLTGLLLLAGLASLGLAIRLWRRLGPIHAPAERAAALSGWVMILPVLGLFLHAGVNFIFYVVPLALLAGLYLARARWAAGPLPSWRVHLPANPRLLGALYGVAASLAVGAITLDWLASQAFDPDNHWPVFAERRANPLTRYQMATAFAALRPHHLATQQTLTTTAIDLAMADRNGPTGALWADIALQHGKDWLAAGRGNPYAYFAIGQLRWQFPSLAPQMGPEFPADPEAILRRAVERDWINAENYLLLARYQEAQNHPDLALATLLSALRWSGAAQTSMGGVNAWKRLYQKTMDLADQIKQPAAAVALARIVVQFDPENATAHRLLTVAPPAFAMAARSTSSRYAPHSPTLPARDINAAWMAALHSP
jgi:O-antigen ligase